MESIVLTSMSVVTWPAMVETVPAMVMGSDARTFLTTAPMSMRWLAAR